MKTALLLQNQKINFKFNLMTNINKIEFKELTKEELRNIYGGEDGDFLYYTAFAVGWLTEKVKQAGEAIAETTVTMGQNNPVGTWN